MGRSQDTQAKARLQKMIGVKVYLGLHAVGEVRGWLKKVIYRGSDQAEKKRFRKLNQ